MILYRSCAPTEEVVKWNECNRALQAFYGKVVAKGWPIGWRNQVLGSADEFFQLGADKQGKWRSNKLHTHAWIRTISSSTFIGVNLYQHCNSTEAFNSLLKTFYSDALDEVGLVIKEQLKRIGWSHWLDGYSDDWFDVWYILPKCLLCTPWEKLRKMMMVADVDGDLEYADIYLNSI
jgi:hypothetical protein